MKVQLVANLAANGELILMAQSDAYEAPEEVSGMGFGTAMKCGNAIMGLTTYQLFSQIMKEVFDALDVVVLNPEEVEGDVYTAKSPEDAVHYLEGKGYDTACVVGGAMTYNSFFAAGLADELFFNLFPVVIGGGGTLETTPGSTLGGYRLAEVKACGDVAMTHFVRE
ncbi:MAG: dihydrofolate reductase family protein [Lachnospiraceae bacterium]|nr:dihydrofolate reductase family protein [Lachnospiraceae bacterium]